MTSSRGMRWPWILMPPRRRGPTARASAPVARPGTGLARSAAVRPGTPRPATPRPGPAGPGPAGPGTARPAAPRPGHARHRQQSGEPGRRDLYRGPAAVPPSARTPSRPDQSPGLLRRARDRIRDRLQGPAQIRGRETDQDLNGTDRDRTRTNLLRDQREDRAADRTRSSVDATAPLRGPRLEDDHGVTTRTSITSRRHRHRCHTSIR